MPRDIDIQKKQDVRVYDAIVIGSGAAGMKIALNLAPLNVLLLTKTPQLSGGSTAYAQGGIAAAYGSQDSADKHEADTLYAGAGLVDGLAAKALTKGGKQAMDQLVEMNMPFDRDESGQIKLGREAAHCERRVLHAGGDATGKHLAQTLATQVKQANHIETQYNSYALELIIKNDNLEKIVTGVLVYNDEVGFEKILSPHVVLATGGVGQLFSHTTNPLESTADGLGLAYRAGARLSDLEFIQYHPTALAVETKQGRRPLLTEALRGEGAYLVDDQGNRFMKSVHPMAELAPRDVVARSVWTVNGSGGQAYLDVRHFDHDENSKDRFELKFPTVFEILKENGLDPAIDLLPVAPAVHYHMGGVETDLNGQASLKGLYAIGEVARTGVHGANRLASNSLLECLVFANRLTKVILENPNNLWVDLEQKYFVRDDFEILPKKDVSQGGNLRQELKQTIYKALGLARNELGLKQGLQALEELYERYKNQDHNFDNYIDIYSFLSALELGKLMINQALKRTESRGAHYRVDYPQTLTNFEYSLTIEDSKIDELIKDKDLRSIEKLVFFAREDYFIHEPKEARS